MLDDWERENEEQDDDGQYGAHDFGPSFHHEQRLGAAAAGGSRKQGINRNAPAGDVQRSPIFSVDLLQSDVSGGHGDISSMAAGNGVVVVGTSDGWLVRYDFVNDDVTHTLLSAAKPAAAAAAAAAVASPSVQRVFLDPGGMHALAAVRSGDAGTEEVWYSHARWRQTTGQQWLAIGQQASQQGGRSRGEACAVSKMKGVAVTAVAWNPHQPSEASTREVVLASKSGQLWEVVMVEKERKEKSARLLYTATEMDEPFTAVQMAVLRDSSAPSRFVVAAATPSRLFIFMGTSSLEATFAEYSTRQPRCIELPPNALNSSDLVFFGRQQRHFERFAWLAGPGLMHGQLDLAGQLATSATSAGGSGATSAAGASQGAAAASAAAIEESSGSLADSSSSSSWIGNALSLLWDKSLIAYDSMLPVLPSPQDLSPTSLLVSEWHFLVLFKNQIAVVNQVSEKAVEHLSLSPLFLLQERGGGKGGGLLGLVCDPVSPAYYAFSRDSIFEITARNESRDMWRVFLKKGDYALALASCHGEEELDEVYAAQAEAAFSAGQYERAASFFSKVVRQATFEEIALKFVAAGQPDALRSFLLHRLDHLDDKQRAQMTLVATWAAELYLDNLNRIQLRQVGSRRLEGDDSDGQEGGNAAGERESEGGGAEQQGEYERVERELRAFLSDCKDILDEATTMKLLASYGRDEEMALFADLRQQHETVVEHHIRHRNASAALDILRRPSVPEELLYKFGPALMQLDPKATIELWMTSAVSSSLQPRRLIPGLLQSNSKLADDCSITFLRFCIRDQACRDSAVHNAFLSLLAHQDDEEPLLEFLSSSGEGGTQVLYDPKYALRVCLENGKMRSCVQIYSTLGMHEEAVALALQVDLQLAKKETARVKTPGGATVANADLAKRLWLMVARHVISECCQGEGEQERARGVQNAIGFLKETEGMLKIEDVLPLFPDFCVIDDFRDAIVASLEGYGSEITALKRQMEDTTRGAEDIRRDIAALSERYAVVGSNDTCGICAKKLLIPPPRQGKGLLPFFVFPCEHAFHSHCLEIHILQNADQVRVQQIELLRQKLNLCSGKPQSNNKQRSRSLLEEDLGSLIDTNEAEKVRAQLDDAIACECPFCGELMVNTITRPFIRMDEPDIDVWCV